MLSHVFQVSAQRYPEEAKTCWVRTDQIIFTCLQHKRLMLDADIQLYLHNILEIKTEF